MLRSFLVAMALLWTAALAASLVWNHAESRRNTIEQARIQAGIAYEKDVLYRRWNANQGGVYVPVSPGSAPNPFLADHPGRDLVTTSGMRLTLMNPAYMTRQVHELGRLQRGVFGHITSLRPLRPENAADPWETRALQAFERGESEVVSVERMDGEDVLRLMRPIVTEESCLPCHAEQGYEAGDTRGGISVSVPLEPLAALSRRHLASVTGVHLLLWLAGLAFIAVGGVWLSNADRRRRDAEEELRRDRETLRLLYEGNPDAVAVIDRDYRVLYANQRVQDLTGISLEALKGRTCHQGILGCAAPCEGCRLEDVFREGRPEGRIKHEVTAAGHENWLWQQWYPVRGAGGRVESVVEIARDVTPLKRAEVELQRHAAELEEANRVKDLFADIISHDLLNPASTASLFLERLREGERSPERLRLVDAATRNVERMIRMIQNASSYSKLREMQEIERRVEDLGEVVREALADLEPQLKAAGMSVEGPPSGRYPAAVNPLLAHVVANLVANAVKYAAEGRRIALGIEDGGGEWVLSVKDWGEGIPDEHKKSIFTRFERLKKEGVKGIGLGLAIASRIVELHGGRIWVQDNPEGGCDFRVALPKASAAE